MSGIDAGPDKRNPSPRAPELAVLADGSLAFLWDDQLQPLSDLGEVTIRRASHVEPEDGGWIADLSPMGGPRLGPYRLRGEALAAEREWLNLHLARSIWWAVRESNPGPAD